MKRWTAITAVAALLLYAILWIGWMQNWAWLSAVDQWMLDAGRSASIRYPAWASGVGLVLRCGPLAFRILRAGLILALLLRRRRRDALFVFLTVEVSGFGDRDCQGTADRPRPDARMVDPYGSSFPSGHAG